MIHKIVPMTTENETVYYICVDCNDTVDMDDAVCMTDTMSKAHRLKNLLDREGFDTELRPFINNHNGGDYGTDGNGEGAE